MKIRKHQYLIASLFLAAVLTAFIAVPVQATWPSWVPGTYIGYAEQDEDMTPNSYYDYYGTFNQSQERVWFHWEEEDFDTTHTSHYFSVWVWVDDELDVAIGVIRNHYVFAQMWQSIMVDDGEEGYDEVLGTTQFTSSGYYAYWDGLNGNYIVVWVFCQGGYGDFHVRIFVTDS